jgi:hypothetical protein
MVFSNSPRRKTPKNVIKQNRGKMVLSFFWGKPFHTIFFQKVFRSAFEFSSLENTKNAIKPKKREENLTLKKLSIVLKKVCDIDMDLLQKYVMAFFNSTYRRQRLKAVDTWVGGSGI